MNKLNKKGFTLIEMLVVIAIIAVLVSIIVPVVSNSTEKAAAAANAANLRSVSASVAIAYMDGTLDNTKTSFSETDIENAGIEVPAAKTVKSVTGGTFTCTVTNGNIVCSYGSDGTITAYSNIAQGLNADGTKPS